MASEQIGRRGSMGRGPMAFLVSPSVMWEWDDSHLDVMRWEWWGVLLRDTSNLPPMHWQWQKSFISGDLGMLNEGLLILRTEIWDVFTSGAVGGGTQVNTDSTHRHEPSDAAYISNAKMVRWYRDQTEPDHWKSATLTMYLLSYKDIHFAEP